MARASRPCSVTIAPQEYPAHAAHLRRSAPLAANDEQVGEKPSPRGDGAVAAGSGFSLSFVEASFVPPPESEDRHAPAQTAPLAPYVLTSLIGSGGQGEVWEAWQASLRRVVAVKIHKAGSGDERFAREALVTAQLDHPAIVPVLDFGQLTSAAGAPGVAMAMKRLRGARWDELIGAEFRRSGAAATQFLQRHIGILETVCQAVSYAHSKGILHLDLKPSQVIVGEYGETYLCDWGMAARAVSGKPLEFVSQPRGPFGTPGFMAPEQALGDLDSISLATDVYLLGGLAYFIACARLPHPGETTRERLESGRRNDVSPMPDSVPVTLQGVIRKALATRPTERFGSAEDFRLALREALQRVAREEEAAALLADAESKLGADARSSYESLAAIEALLDRALVLAPDHSSASALRDTVLLRHTLLAVERGDLELAQVISARIDDAGSRGSAAGALATARLARAAREQQRVRARRAATAALVALVVVLVGATYFLTLAFQRVDSERNRTAAALAESRRELARASLQAALSYLDKDRPADARAALRRVPDEWRGWEWGYLASRAVPEMRLLRPRQEVISHVELSPDGQWVGAIRSSDKALIVMRRDAASPPVLLDESRRWTALGHHGGGAGLVAAAEDGTITIVEDGAELWRGSIGEEVTHVGGSSDGVVLAFGASGRLWRTAQGEAPAVALECEEELTQFSMRGRHVAFGTDKGSVWHGEAGGAIVKTAAGHLAPVSGIAWHPTLPRFATWAAEKNSRQPLIDSRAIIHDVGSETPHHTTAAVEFALTAAAWTPDGDSLGLAFSNAWYHRLDARAWTLAQSGFHGVAISEAMHYLPDASHFVLVSRKAVQVRESQWLGQTMHFEADPRRLTSIRFHGNSLIGAGVAGGLGEWSLLTAPHLNERDITPDQVLSLDAARDVDLLLAAHRWGWTTTWAADPALRRVGAGQVAAQEVTQTRLSADGSRAVSASQEGRLALHAVSAAGLEQVRVWETSERLRAVAIDSAGRRIAAATEDGRLLLLNTESDATTTELTWAAGEWSAIEFHPDDRQVALGANDGTMKIATLDAESIAPLNDLHRGPVTRLAFSADGASLVSASVDETAMLWNVAERKLLARYEGTHAGAVTSALLTPDGTRVITASEDSLVRVFDAKSGVELVALEGHEYGVRDMDFLGGGERLVTTGPGSTIRLWRPLPAGRGDGVLDEDPSPYRPPAATQP